MLLRIYLQVAWPHPSTTVRMHTSTFHLLPGRTEKLILCRNAKHRTALPRLLLPTRSISCFSLASPSPPPVIVVVSKPIGIGQDGNREPPRRGERKHQRKQEQETRAESKTETRSGNKDGEQEQKQTGNSASLVLSCLALVSPLLRRSRVGPPASPHVRGRLTCSILRCLSPLARLGALLALSCRAL